MAVRLLQTTRFVTRVYRTVHALRRGALAPADAGRRLAADVTDMGPLYIKMAQFVSTRRDAVDPDLADALASVQDDVPPGDAAPPTLEGYRFDPAPVGSASIAVVFRGVRLADGADVVVKRRREGVERAVRRDLPLLLGVMTAAAAARLPGAANMRDLIRETSPVVLGELDFRREAEAQTDFRRRMRGVPWLAVPEVLHAQEDAMVSAYQPSRRLGDVAAPNPALAARLMDLYMLMLTRGAVHADPHPGNLGVRPGGELVLYDFGAVVRVAPETRERVASLLSAVVVRDVDGVARALGELGVLVPRPDQRLPVRRALRRVLDSQDVHAELQNSEAFVGGDGARAVAFRREFIYLARTFALVEAACRRLDPGFAYDYAAWLDAQPGEGLARLARDTVALPAALHTMQADMEDFQVRVAQEMRGAKAFAVLAAAGALAAALLT